MHCLQQNLLKKEENMNEQSVNERYGTKMADHHFSASADSAGAIDRPLHRLTAHFSYSNAFGDSVGCI